MLLKLDASNWPVVRQDGSTVSQTQAVALGLGSLFNHSTLNQNVGWERDVVAQCITYRALRDIRAGDELYVILECRLSISNQMLRAETRSGLFLHRDMFRGSIHVLKRQR